MRTSFWEKLIVTVVIALALMWSAGEFLLISDRAHARGPLATEGGVASTTSKAPATVEHVRGDVKVVMNAPALIPEAGEQQSATTTITDTRAPLETISASLTIDGKTYPHQIAKGASVADLLILAQKAGELNFVGNNYSGLGMLVVSINGKENNMHHNNMYWIYSVNGTKATVGVSAYTLTAGDAVTWSYEPNTY